LQHPENKKIVRERIMQTKLVMVSVLALAVFAGCSGQSNSGSATSGSAMIAFVKTQDGSPLEIKAELFDTAQAKKFSNTGKNPYIGNADAIAQGKKLFQMYSCTQCHGGDAGGQTGPSLHGPDFRYAKDATNKGMFETIWHGTNGGMGAKGKGLMDPTDPSNGLKPDEVLQIQAWIRSHNDKLTGNE
jgi:cytochrome c-L